MQNLLIGYFCGLATIPVLMFIAAAIFGQMKIPLEPKTSYDTAPQSDQ